MYQCRVFFPSIIHNHACRVKPECLSVEPEKVGAFSCRKSDFIPVFTPDPINHCSLFIEQRNSLFAREDFLPNWLKNDPEGEMGEGRNDFICWLRLAWDLLANKTTWSKVCNNSTLHTSAYISPHPNLLITNQFYQSQMFDCSLSWSVSQGAWPQLPPGCSHLGWKSIVHPERAKIINTQTNMKRNHWRMLMCNPNQLSSADIWWMKHDLKRMNVLQDIVYSDPIWLMLMFPSDQVSHVSITAPCDIISDLWLVNLP